MCLFLPSAATVQFTQHIYVFNESARLVRIPITRSGYTRGNSIVKCDLKQQTAIGGAIGSDSDFVADRPEVLTFREGETEQCKIGF